MKSKPYVFVDSDVIISSLMSRTGVAFLLLNTSDIDRFISDISYKELRLVVHRFKLDENALSQLIKEKFTVSELNDVKEKIEEKFVSYVADVNDAHIVAGAVKARAQFLITYNIRHFKIDKIKIDFDIVILTPARFLQYLRSVL